VAAGAIELSIKPTSASWECHMTERATDHPAAAGRAMETAVMFVDLISSSEFSSILSLKDYADYVATFEDVCTRQCEFFFHEYNRNEFKKGRHWEMTLLGDELVVFFHSDTPENDVYQMISLAVSLKCAWLASRVNVERIKQGAPSAELAIGIHAGRVWAVPDGAGFHLRGFAINVAKRVETSSRDGQHFRIFISGAAFKRVNRKIQNLLIGPKQLVAMKGIVVPVAVHELVDSFLGLTARLHPDFLRTFRSVAKKAIASNSFDSWIHSCYQVSEGERNGKVSTGCMELCRDVLNIQPNNGVAMFYLAEGLKDLKQTAAAILLYRDLTCCWPTYTLGWLQLARAAKATGNLILAEQCVLQARRNGAADDDESLPDLKAVAA
jgi:class 3 adenylate cyclase